MWSNVAKVNVFRKNPTFSDIIIKKENNLNSELNKFKNNVEHILSYKVEKALNIEINQSLPKLINKLVKQEENTIASFFGCSCFSGNVIDRPTAYALILLDIKEQVFSGTKPNEIDLSISNVKKRVIDKLKLSRSDSRIDPLAEYLNEIKIEKNNDKFFICFTGSEFKEYPPIAFSKLAKNYEEYLGKIKYSTRLTSKELIKLKDDFDCDTLTTAFLEVFSLAVSAWNETEMKKNFLGSIGTAHIGISSENIEFERELSPDLRKLITEYKHNPSLYKGKLNYLESVCEFSDKIEDIMSSMLNMMEKSKCSQIAAEIYCYDHKMGLIFQDIGNGLFKVYCFDPASRRNLYFTSILPYGNSFSNKSINLNDYLSSISKEIRSLMRVTNRKMLILARCYSVDKINNKSNSITHKGYDVNFNENQELEWESALLMAIQINDYEFVKKLIEQGAKNKFNFNFILGENKINPLVYITRFDYKGELLKLLLEAGKEDYGAGEIHSAAIKALTSENKAAKKILVEFRNKNKLFVGIR